jgi:hypothetical protein
MNEFARGFLNEDWEAVPEAPRVFVGAFGKHPGWNDHLDDIGLVTTSLVHARRVLYGGISSQVESAAWEKAGPDRVGSGFNHLVHWRRPYESLTGLMWSSQDGKGRALYPMVALAHCVGQPYPWIADVVLPALQTAAAACRATSSAAMVLTALNDGQQFLRRRATAGPMKALPEYRSSASVGFFRREPVAVQRVLHHLRHQFAIFAPGRRDWMDNDKQAQSGSVRLPQIPGSSPMESLHAWLAFLEVQLDPAVPMLGLVPLDANWLDVIVGEPAPADLFVLRALPTAVPLVTDIPYRLDAETLAACAGIAAELEHGQVPETSLFNNTSVAENRVAAARSLARCRAGARPGLFRRLFKSVG